MFLFYLFSFLDNSWSHHSLLFGFFATFPHGTFKLSTDKTVNIISFYTTLIYFLVTTLILDFISFFFKFTLLSLVFFPFANYCSSFFCFYLYSIPYLVLFSSFLSFILFSFSFSSLLILLSLYLSKL